MLLQWCSQFAWKHRYSVFTTFSITHQNFGASKVHIFHAQTNHFHQTHSGAIQQPCHQAMHTMHSFQHRSNLGLRQHHRQMCWSLGAHHILHPGQILIQHFSVQKQQCRQGLVLRGRRNMTIHCPMRQKRFDLQRAHIGRVLLAVEQNEALNPMGISNGYIGARLRC